MKELELLKEIEELKAKIKELENLLGPSLEESPLTYSQKQVGRYLLEGKSNQEIAQALGVQPGTIRFHIYQIFKTLKIKNRTQFVLMFLRR